MATRKSFDNYIIKMLGGNKGRIALILCYQGKSYIGRIDFYPDGEKLPDDYLWTPKPSNEHIIIHMPISRFEAVLSFIRNEKNLYMKIDVMRKKGVGIHGQGALINSDRDPTTEEEGTPKKR